MSYVCRHCIILRGGGVRQVYKVYTQLLMLKKSQETVTVAREGTRMTRTGVGKLSLKRAKYLTFWAIKFLW